MFSVDATEESFITEGYYGLKGVIILAPVRLLSLSGTFFVLISSGVLAGS